MSKKHLFLLLTAVSLSCTAFATGGKDKAAPDSTAGPSGTEIFMYQLDIDGENISLSNPKNITTRIGYDNQPEFSLSGRQVYYVSMVDGQTDIYRYDIVTQSTEQITKTEKESEYSPKMLYDKAHFSVVKVERDSTQRLWLYPLNGGEATVVNKKIDKIGYYCWMGTNNFAYFHIGEQANTLKTANFKAKEPYNIKKDKIGRSMHRVPAQSYMSYVYKKDAENWFIERMNIYTDEISTVIKALPGSEDHAWTPGGILISAKGKTLYKYEPGKDKGWVEVCTLDEYGVGSISRIAIDPKGKHIAIVFDELSADEEH